MPIDTDPGIWKQISGWLWALLAIPIASIWKKADGAVQKDDLKDYLREAKEERREMRENIIKLFDKVDEVRSDVNDHALRLTQEIASKADRP